MTLDSLSISEADEQEREFQEQQAKRRIQVQKGQATIGTLYEDYGGFGNKARTCIPFEKLVVEEATSPVEGDSWLWTPSTPARLTANSALGYFLRSAKAIDTTINKPKDIEGKRISFEVAVLDNGLDRAGQPLNPTTTFKVTAIGGSANGASKPAAPTFTDAELDEAAQKVIGLSSEEAVAIVGDKLQAIVAGAGMRVVKVNGVFTAK